jgi:hypothetical protein
MRTPLHTLASLLAPVLLALPAGAVTTVFLDFESLADTEPVTTQFAADGITFGNAVALTAGMSLNEIDFPPSSGTDVISGFGSGPLTISFLQPADSVQLNLVSAGQVTLSYFDASNALILSNSTGSFLGVPIVTGTPAGLAIAKMTLANAGGNADTFTVDNLLVRLDDREIPPIPEPSAFLAMACGLVTVGASLRRRA